MKKMERIAGEILRIAKELAAASIYKEFVTEDQAAVWTLEGGGEAGIPKAEREAKSDIAK